LFIPKGTANGIRIDRSLHRKWKGKFTNLSLWTTSVLHLVPMGTLPFLWWPLFLWDHRGCFLFRIVH